MMRIIPFVVTALLVLTGCETSSGVSPLVFCDRPGDHNARYIPNCTQRIGNEAP
jgi:hypothetical protein